MADAGRPLRLLVDATTLLAWAGPPPMGTVRVERLVVGELCRCLPADALVFGKARGGAFMPVTPAQRAAIERLAAGAAETEARGRAGPARCGGLGAGSRACGDGGTGRTRRRACSRV